MPHMVERQQTVEEHERAIRHLQIVFCQHWKLFQFANNIVSEEAYSASGKWRQSGDSGRCMLAQQAIEDLENAAFHLRFFAIALKSDLAAASPQHHVRPRAKKGVAANLLPAFNRL